MQIVASNFLNGLKQRFSRTKNASLRNASFHYAARKHATLSIFASHPPCIQMRFDERYSR